MSDKGKAPVVFISYSHDTPAHKKWVGELASRLVEKGVEVILDQWDLGLGDDVPKFMERAVGGADRVLMICTEAYVHKADGGKGGVGYEAMVVTGELVKDQGTAKFIPIVRQAPGGSAVPKCVSTRFWANLSEGQNFEEEFEKVLRELHAAPKLRKPTLGQNPFTEEKAAVASGIGESFPAKLVTTGMAEAMHGRAVSALRADDQFAWRQVLKDAKQVSWAGLAVWRKEFDAAGPATHEDLPPMVDKAFAAFSPLFAVAFAGIESGHERFSNQIGMVDDLLSPPNWNGGGLGVITEIPDTLVFLYQALHGAVCLDTGQLHLGLRLAQSKFRRLRDAKSKALFEQKRCIGWPYSLGEHCSKAWDYLKDLPDRHEWLLSVFGTKMDYQAALSSYYASLNLLELADLVAKGGTNLLDGRQLVLSVPLCGFAIAQEVVPKAYRQLTADVDALKEIWVGVGVDTAAMARHWPAWMLQCKQWLAGVYARTGGYDGELYVEDLFGLPGLKPAAASTSNIVKP